MDNDNFGSGSMKKSWKLGSESNSNYLKEEKDRASKDEVSCSFFALNKINIERELDMTS